MYRYNFIIKYMSARHTFNFLNLSPPESEGASVLTVVPELMMLVLIRFDWIKLDFINEQRTKRTRQGEQRSRRDVVLPPLLMTNFRFAKMLFCVLCGKVLIVPVARMCVMCYKTQKVPNTNTLACRMRTDASQTHHVSRTTRVRNQSHATFGN